MHTKIAFATIAAMIATMTSCKHAAETESASAITVDVATPTVDTVTLSTRYPGTLSAKSSVDVVAKVNGQILTKNYQSGAMVKEGQVLFTIDSSTYRDQVKQAQATLSTAKSALDYAREHYEAVKKALESEAVSKMEVVQAQSQYEQAESQVKNAQAALESAQRLLSYCTITAPITGYASDNTKGSGNYVTGQGSPFVMCTIYDNTTVTATFSIEDEKYQDIVKSIAALDSLNFNKVPVTFDQDLPHAYTGEVSYMAPALNTSTGSLQVKCRIDNPWNELRPGMYVEVDLPYGRLYNAILVKDASIGTDQLGKYLYVVNDSNKVVYTPVKVGPLYQDSLRVIKEGIKATDRYVTSAMLKVRDGMTVSPRSQK